MEVFDMPVTIVDSVFETNESKFNGGCLILTGNSYLRNVTFSGCRAGTGNGAVWNYGAFGTTTSVFESRTFVNNTALAGNAGGVGNEEAKDQIIFLHCREFRYDRGERRARPGPFYLH